jgi:hypothetical protein
MKSIQGCAVMWDAVVQAHIRAARKTQAGSTEYIKKLAEETSLLCASIEENCPKNVGELTPTRCANCLMFARTGGAATALVNP